jgi:chromosome condensin MukBEF ATPase and DNA-binding subunit MukB
MMVLFLSIAAIFIMRGPFGRAIAERIAGRARTATEDQDVRELKGEVEELRHLTEQMSELGERVDFLERLVAKQREAERLPPVR